MEDFDRLVKLSRKELATRLCEMSGVEERLLCLSRRVSASEDGRRFAEHQLREVMQSVTAVLAMKYPEPESFLATVSVYSSPPVRPEEDKPEEQRLLEYIQSLCA